MIHDERWAHVRKKMQEYDGWENGGLEVKGKKGFSFQAPEGWKQMKAGYFRQDEDENKEDWYDLAHLLGYCFCRYELELDLERQARKGASVGYEEGIGREFDKFIGLLDGIEALPDMPTSQKNDIQKLKDQVNRVRKKIRTPWSERAVKIELQKQGMYGDNLGRKDAENRLIHNLDLTLEDFTNLRQSDRTRHIARLLHHMDVKQVGDVDREATRIRRWLSSDRGGRIVDQLTRGYLPSLIDDLMDMGEKEGLTNNMADF
jgi:hypothetical protein